MGDSFQIMIVMIVYMLVVIGIGLAFARRPIAARKTIFWAGGGWGPGSPP